MTLKALRDLADKTPGMTKKKKVGKKWENMDKAELLEEFRAFDAKKGAQPLAGPRWEEMSLKALRDLADKTPGMTRKKKVGTKWVNMAKPELVEEFKAFEAKKGAQPLAGPKTDLEKRLSKKTRQISEEYKVKKRRRENAPMARRQRLARLWGEAQRTAKRAAQRTEPYKEKKRARENAPEAKVKRKQRKLFLFWQDCFRRWALLRRLRECRLSPLGKWYKDEAEMRRLSKCEVPKLCGTRTRPTCEWHEVFRNLPCAEKWWVPGAIPHYETAIEMQRLAESSGMAVPYAPRFHTDGRLSVVQHGVVRFLPCCGQPRGPQSLTGGGGAAAEEYRFALSLRCR